ncbi:MAG: tetratricopeptide repeat protein, partial [Verrucomicrobiae bacterium]|nr:tetratricopeptide repeat protein [Verrucomicrobiae bacterium]
MTPKRITWKKAESWGLALLLGGWFPLVFWVRPSSGPATTLYDGMINAEAVSALYLWIAAPIVLWCWFRRRRPLQLSGFGLLPLVTTFGLFGLAAASIFWSPAPYLSQVQALMWFHYAMVAILFLLARRTGGLRVVLWALVVAGLSMALPVIYIYFRNGLYVPYLGLGVNRSVTGEALLLPTLLCLGCGCKMRRAPVLLPILRVCGLMFFMAVIMLGQRAPVYGMLLALAGMGLCLVMAEGRVRKRVGAMALVLGAILTVLIYIPSQWSRMGEGVWDGSQRLINAGQAGEAKQYRVLGMGIAWEQWKRSPLVGTGAGTFPVEYPSTRAAFLGESGRTDLGVLAVDLILMRAHVEPAQLAGELGLLGLALWGLLFAGVPVITGWRALWRRGQTPVFEMFYGAGVGAVMVSSLASSFGPRALPSVFLIFAGAALLGSGRSRVSGGGVRIAAPALVWLMVLAGVVTLWGTYRKVQDFRSVSAANHAESLIQRGSPTVAELTFYYEQAIEASPGLGFSYAAVGRMMARHGKLAEAVAFFEESERAGVVHLSNRVNRLYGLWLAGRREEALELARELHRMAPGKDAAALHYSVLLEASGHRAQAQTVWDHIPAKNRTGMEPVREVFRQLLRREPVMYTAAQLSGMGKDGFDGLYYLSPSFWGENAELERRMQAVRENYRDR